MTIHNCLHRSSNNQLAIIAEVMRRYFQVERSGTLTGTAGWKWGQVSNKNND